MKKTEIIMGMPVMVEIVDYAPESAFQEVFDYFRSVDERFSTYKDTSEISRINRGEITEAEYSKDMETIFALAEETRKLTDGYFNIRTPAGTYDPSGIVKGWAIYNAAKLLKQRGFKNFYVDAGGDIQTHGKNSKGERWTVGIQDPFSKAPRVVKVLHIENEGVATSGTYIRGQHIYNPKRKHEAITEIVSLTVVGPNIYEADRFATAAFAMGKDGIMFIERLAGFEGYMIDSRGIATMTSGFEVYTL